MTAQGSWKESHYNVHSKTITDCLQKVSNSVGELFRAAGFMCGPLLPTPVQVLNVWIMFGGNCGHPLYLVLLARTYGSCSPTKAVFGFLVLRQKCPSGIKGFLTNSLSLFFVGDLRSFTLSARTESNMQLKICGLPVCDRKRKWVEQNAHIQKIK